MALTHLEASVVLIMAVGAVTLALTFLAAAAWQRTRNDKLLYVTTAFALFALKSAVTAAAIGYDLLGHHTVEVLGSAFDLVIVLLLVAPFVVRQ